MIQRNKLIILLLLSLLVLVASCEKEKSANPADTFCADPITNPSYANDIIPILEQHCYQCHDNENNGSFADFWDLEDYEDIFPLAKDGNLLGVVRHDPGFTPMPLNGIRIPLCDRIAIEEWINNGAPDN